MTQSLTSHYTEKHMEDLYLIKFSNVEEFDD